MVQVVKFPKRRWRKYRAEECVKIFAKLSQQEQLRFLIIARDAAKKDKAA